MHPNEKHQLRHVLADPAPIQPVIMPAALDLSDATPARYETTKPDLLAFTESLELIRNARADAIVAVSPDYLESLVAKYDLQWCLVLSRCLFEQIRPFGMCLADRTASCGFGVDVGSDWRSASGVLR